jgi:pyruvate ferredoxin oxidoreductase delta subunit
MSWDFSKIKEWKVGDHPAGATIPEGGTAAQYKTGGWRSEKPVWNEGVCSHCMICWIFCPDSSVLVKDERLAGIDYDHCKGCGICAAECPKNALEMKEEDR